MKNIEKIQVCQKCTHFKRTGTLCGKNELNINIHNLNVCPENKWIAAEPEKFILISPRAQRKAASFVKAQMSILKGKPEEQCIVDRYNSCYGCKFNLVNDKQENYCSACGCGQNITLKSKIETYSYLECPEGKKGFSNEGDPWPKE